MFSSLYRDKSLKDERLRDWATKLVNANSPVPLPTDVQKDLRTGLSSLGSQHELAGPKGMHATWLLTGHAPAKVKRIRQLRCPIHGMGPWLPTPLLQDVDGVVLRYCCDVLLDKINCELEGQACGH